MPGAIVCGMPGGLRVYSALEKPAHDPKDAPGKKVKHEIAWTLDGVTWDRHYHVILWSDLRLRRLLEELGLGAELEWRTARTGVFAGGRLFSMSNPLEFLLFPALGLVDKARLAATVLYASRITDGRPLESERVEDWARRWSGDATFERFWLPLLRSKLGEGAAKVPTRKVPNFVIRVAGLFDKDGGIGTASR